MKGDSRTLDTEHGIDKPSIAEANEHTAFVSCPQAPASLYDSWGGRWRSGCPPNVYSAAGLPPALEKRLESLVTELGEAFRQDLSDAQKELICELEALREKNA